RIGFIQRRLAMKRLAVVLSFSIALLSVPIEARAQQQETQDQQQAMLRLQQFMADQAAIAQSLTNIANMRHQVMRDLANQLRDDQGAQQGAAQIQVQAQQYPVANCVRFPQNANPEAEVQYLISHPGARVCPGPNPDLAGQARTLDN